MNQQLLYQEANTNPEDQSATVKVARAAAGKILYVLLSKVEWLTDWLGDELR